MSPFQFVGASQHKKQYVLFRILPPPRVCKVCRFFCWFCGAQER
jgi:hypothetical protein